MNNISKHISLIGSESLYLLESLLNGEHNITSTINSPGFKLYEKDGVIRDGVEHITMVSGITARDSHKTMEQFIKTILQPLVTLLAEAIKKLEKEYALYVLPLPENKVGCVCSNNNLGIRILKNYNLNTRGSELSMEIALIEKGNVLKREIRQK